MQNNLFICRNLRLVRGKEQQAAPEATFHSFNRCTVPLAACGLKLDFLPRMSQEQFAKSRAVSLVPLMKDHRSRANAF